MVGSSIWRRGMLRKFSNLIFASESNMNVGECIEEGFKMMKDKIIAEVRPYYVDNSENEGRSSDIKDRVGRRAKRVRNCNKAKGKMKSNLMCVSMIKTVVQLSMTNEDLGKNLNAPSSDSQLSLEIYNSGNAEPSSNSKTFSRFYNYIT
ncbi:hypothetical protein M9H77_35160 [Catharanthus roseus]|uniref:Uncharacterized protein n=1 Tax=Catharanthus roseus TaxID=4058 RepID=A0ACB9ZNZ4_CATRO|nr:hypothetical protein M9H77_35160 [Catharanthus roseus]